jgi:hypothetical protein
MLRSRLSILYRSFRLHVEVDQERLQMGQSAGSVPQPHAIVDSIRVGSHGRNPHNVHRVPSQHWQRRDR